MFGELSLTGDVRPCPGTFAVADVITVMVEGQVLESGSPAQIRGSAAVRQAYLGDGLDA